MAGLYADVPDRRMPYDRDGSTGFKLHTNNGALSAMTTAELAEMNDEDDGATTISFEAGGNGNFYWAGIIFPELRDLTGFWLWGSARGWYDGTVHNSTTLYIDTSTDTTNGSDGTWTRQVSGGYGYVVADVACQFTEDSTTQLPIRPTYRTDWRTGLTTPDYGLPYNGIKAVRFYGGPWDAGPFAISCLHLYGDTTEVCRITHPTSDVEVGAAWFDFGEVAQGETYVQTFRVKNTDATRTATSIAIGTDVATDASTPIGGQLEYSDGGAYATSINIGNLGPGVISGVITLRFTVASAADLGVWAARVVANPASLV